MQCWRRSCQEQDIMQAWMLNAVTKMSSRWNTDITTASPAPASTEWKFSCYFVSYKSHAKCLLWPTLIGNMRGRKSGKWRFSPVNTIHIHHIMKIQLHTMCSRAHWKNVPQTLQSQHILIKMTLSFYILCLEITHQHSCPTQEPGNLRRFFSVLLLMS